MDGEHRKQRNTKAKTYAVATALTVLRNSRASGSCGLRIGDGGGDCWHRRCDDSGSRCGLSWSLANGGGDGIALVDHGSFSRAILDRVTAWESTEVYRVTSQLAVPRYKKRSFTSSFGDFVDLDLLSAAVHVGIRDESKFAASRGVATEVGAAVHSPLERVTLPAEDVVSVLAEASADL